MTRRRAAEEMRSYWDERARENAAFYVDTTCNYDEPDMERFLEAGRRIVAAGFVDAPVQPQGRELAVELGSGLGRNCIALAPHFEQVIGVDISEEMVARARASVDVPNVRFEVCSGHDLRPVESGTADLVLAFTVLQHMPSRTVVASNIADVARVLRPGGIAALQWNNQPRLLRWQVMGLVRRVGRRVGVRRWQDVRFAAPFLGRPISWPDMSAMLRRNGLEPRATEGLGTLFAWVWAERS